MEYIIAFDENEFKELKELAQINTDLDRIIAGFEHDHELYHTEKSKMEYCLLLLQIKKLKRRSRLVSRLMDLGNAQDNDFRSYLDSVERDLQRYCPEHH